MSGASLKIDAVCHCGAVSYEATVDPRRTVICHCTDCQTMSGAPYRVNVGVLTRDLRVAGTPRTYVKVGGSGDAVTTAFCGTCGTGLFSYKGDDPKVLNLRIGAIRQRAMLTPRAQGFCASALPWSADISGVPVVST